MPTQDDAAAQSRARWRGVGPAVGLFLLAPLIGEFLLGNLSITWLWALLTLAPLYGGGALLIREIVRRSGWGWPSIVMLGLAYAIVEEAFVTGSLFDPQYAGLRLLDYGYVPALGIGAWWTVFVLALHTIWSTAVPIAMVEAMSVRSRRTPWLGPVGLSVTFLIFIAGCLATAIFQAPADARASPLQLASSAVVVLGLAGLAWFAGQRRPAEVAEGEAASSQAPSLLLTGVLTFMSGSIFMGLAIVHDSIPAVVNVGLMLLVLLIIALAILRRSKRSGGSEAHRLAAAAGFVLTYAWYGFIQKPSVGTTSAVVDVAGNILFSIGAIALLIAGFKRVAREDVP